MMGDSPKSISDEVALLAAEHCLDVPSDIGAINLDWRDRNALSFACTNGILHELLHTPREIINATNSHFLHRLSVRNDITWCSFFPSGLQVLACSMPWIHNPRLFSGSAPCDKNSSRFAVQQSCMYYLSFQMVQQDHALLQDEFGTGESLNADWFNRYSTDGCTRNNDSFSACLVGIMDAMTFLGKLNAQTRLGLCRWTRLDRFREELCVLAASAYGLASFFVEATSGGEHLTMDRTRE